MKNIENGSAKSVEQKKKTRVPKELKKAIYSFVESWSGYLNKDGTYKIESSVYDTEKKLLEDNYETFIECVNDEDFLDKISTRECGEDLEEGYWLYVRIKDYGKLKTIRFERDNHFPYVYNAYAILGQ